MANSINVREVSAGYGSVQVLDRISLSVNDAETVALLGTNGNGKSTLMKCIMGMVRPSAGTVTVEIDGTKHNLVGRSTEEIVDLGIALVPEGRRLFPKLTVEENLLLGAFRVEATDLAVVAGASGGTGQLIARALHAKGIPVRGLTRDPVAAPRIEGVTWIAGDVTRSA